MVRLSYRYEMRSALTFPLAASLAEGGFTGVVAAKYFQASQLLIAVITAAPMFGNIMALLWAELARTRRKVPFVNLLQLGVVLLIAGAALTALVPSRDLGGWLFGLIIISVRLLASGIITIRSAMWRSNYPRHIRGQIIGRISVVATAMLAVATFGGSAWLDHDPRAFMWLYPIAAILGVVGIWQFSHIRVRREGQFLRRQAVYTPRPESLSQTDETNVLNYEPLQRDRPSGLRGFFRLFGEAYDVLRRDRDYRHYQRWQFISGASFMMLGPSLLYMVSREMTDPNTQYQLATVILQIIPQVVSLLTFGLWAPLFDRVHITRFRVYQQGVAMAGQGLIFAGAMAAVWAGNAVGLVIIAMAQVLIGITLAGGNLAWNLGHNDFSTPEKSASYMAVHVMLTGVRGCLAPFLGVALYRISWMGRGVFLVSALMCIVGWLGFYSMSRRFTRTSPERPPAPPEEQLTAVPVPAAVDAGRTGA
jgi:MFS family permease